jgi:hypothetical protein
LILKLDLNLRRLAELLFLPLHGPMNVPNVFLVSSDTARRGKAIVTNHVELSGTDTTPEKQASRADSA